MFFLWNAYILILCLNLPQASVYGTKVMSLYRLNHHLEAFVFYCYCWLFSSLVVVRARLLSKGVVNFLPRCYLVCLAAVK